MRTQMFGVRADIPSVTSYHPVHTNQVLLIFIVYLNYKIYLKLG